MADTYDRTFKNDARERLLTDIAPARSLLTMPGRELLCVEAMLRKRVVKAGTEMVFVERDRDKVPDIMQRAAELGVDPEIVVSDIRHMTPPRDFDLLNLDLEEHFTPLLGDWMTYRMAPRMMEEATLLLTFCKYSQNPEINDFAVWFDGFVSSDERMRRVARECILPFLNHLDEPTPKFTVPAAVRLMLLTGCALNGHVLRFDALEDYADGMPMLAMRARVRRRTGPPALPSFSEIVNLYPGPGMHPRVHDPRIGELRNHLDGMMLDLTRVGGIWNVSVRATGYVLMSSGDISTIWASFLGPEAPRMEASAAGKAARPGPRPN